MKGTLISFDFVKGNSGGLKFLEMNTDTTISDVDLQNYISWDGLFAVMTASAATELDVIYKPEIHQSFVNHLSASVIADAPFVTAFRHHKESLHNIFPTPVEDSPEKFILRLAYDDNAILDNTYCATGHAPLRLLHEFNSSSLAVPFYYSGSEGEVNLLQTASNASNVPDIALKTKTDRSLGLKFAKVSDWDVAIEEFKDKYYLTNYLISSASVNDHQAVWSYRNYSIAYGGGLEPVHLGGFIQHSQFSLPSTSDLSYKSADSDILNSKHYYEFSTSNLKSKFSHHGIYSTDRFVSSSNVAVAPSELFVGQELKSFRIEGQPDTDDPKEYLGWSYSGKSLPSNSGVTQSLVTSNPLIVNDRLGTLVELVPSGSSEKIYLGMQTTVITYNTGSNDWMYRPVQSLNKDKDFLPTQDGTLLPLTEVNLLLLNTPTGSFTTVNIETTDNLIVNTDGEETVLIGFHNKAKIEPPK